MSETVWKIARRFREAAIRMEEAWGNVSLFGLFEHQEGPGRFDVIVAAPGLTYDGQGIDRILEFWPGLESGEGAYISRIIPLQPDDDFVRAVTRALPDIDGELYESGSAVYAGVPIAQAIVLVSHAQAARVEPQKLAA